MRLARSGDNRSRCRSFGALVVIWLLLAACSDPAISSGTGASGIAASSSAPSPTAPTVHLAGRIVFERWDAAQGKTSVFIANADGSSEQIGE